MGDIKSILGEVIILSPARHLPTMKEQNWTKNPFAANLVGCFTAGDGTM